MFWTFQIRQTGVGINGINLKKGSSHDRYCVHCDTHSFTGSNSLSFMLLLPVPVAQLVSVYVGLAVRSGMLFCSNLCLFVLLLSFSGSYESVHCDL